MRALKLLSYHERMNELLTYINREISDNVLTPLVLSNITLERETQSLLSAGIF